jgi:hypothetical protein
VPSTQTRAEPAPADAQPGAAAAPARPRTLWPLVAAGVALELVWLLVAALTFPLTGSLAYARNWIVALGPIWSAFEWVLVRLDALVPGVYAGDQPHPAAAVLFLGAMGIGYAAYLFAIVRLDARPGSASKALGVVVVFAVMFQVTLWFMPGIMTTDLASYVMYGRVAGVYDANPYVVPPAAFPNDSLLPWWIARMWYSTTASYGPLWIDLSWVIARLTGGMDQLGQILTYRLLVNAVHLANLGLVWWLLRRLSTPARLATFVAFAWSPLLLFQIAGNGHNDAVMLLFMLLACATLVSSRHWMVALAWLGLATLLKWTPALMAMYCLAAWLRCLATWRQRLVRLAGAAALLAGLALVVAAPWLQGIVTNVEGILDSVDVGYANWLMDVPAAWFAAHVLDRSGVATEQARATARLVFTVPAVAACAVLIAVELRRLWRTAVPDAPLAMLRAILGASTRTLLIVLVLVSPQVHPWYFSWPLTLGLLLGWRDTTARLAVAYSLLFPPVAFIRDQTGDSPVDPLLVLYAVVPLALPAVAWLRRRPHRLRSDARAYAPPRTPL